MPCTRLPIRHLIIANQDKLYVRSEVEVPEAPANANWLKPMTLFDPLAPLSIPAAGLAPAKFSDAVRAIMIYQQIVDQHEQSIQRAWDDFDARNP